MRRGRYTSLAQVKKANRKYAKDTGRAYWFGPGETRFFNTVLESAMIGGRYFITSERPDRTDPKKYSVREALETGQIDTIGDFRQFASREAAHGYARKLAKMEKGVPDNPIARGYSRETISKNVSLLRREGYDEKQSVAIAYTSARTSWRRRHTSGAFPAHLRGKKR